MKTSRIKSRLGFVLAVDLALAGCAYRLPVPVLPSQEHVKVAAASPEAYTLRLRIREPRDYGVPADGRVTLDIPAYRAECSVYLFGKVRIRSGSNPFTAKAIDVIAGGKILRHLSLKEISALPLDPGGYHMLARHDTRRILKQRP